MRSARAEVGPGPWPTEGQTVAAVDLGSSAVTVAMGAVVDGALALFGWATRPSSGVQRGEVQSVERALPGLQRAIARAELGAGRRITQVCVGVSALGWPMLPTVACCLRAGLDVRAVVPAGWASALAVLDERPTPGPVAVVDLGAGTADIAVFAAGRQHFATTIAAGGALVANDLAVALRIPSAEVRRLLVRFGCTLAPPTGAAGAGCEIVEVSGVGRHPSRVVSREQSVGLAVPRLVEIFELVRKELARVEPRVGRVVLTGGLTSMPGIRSLATGVFGLPVQLGRPRAFDIVPDVRGATDTAAVTGSEEDAALPTSPAFATAAGLLRFAATLVTVASGPVGPLMGTTPALPC